RRSTRCHWAVLTETHQIGISCFWVFATNVFVAYAVSIFLNMFYPRMEFSVEILHHLCPLLFSFGNVVKILLYFCGEIVIENIFEMLHQKVVLDHPVIRVHQLSFI